MRVYRQMSNDLFDLLCVQAEAGRSVNLVAASLHATFEQAKTMVALMDQRGILSLFGEDYDDCEMVVLRLLVGNLTDHASDRPKTPPPDDQPIL